MAWTCIVQAAEFRGAHWWAAHCHLGWAWGPAHCAVAAEEATSAARQGQIAAVQAHLVARALALLAARVAAHAGVQMAVRVVVHAPALAPESATVLVAADGVHVVSAAHVPRAAQVAHGLGVAMTMCSCLA